MIRQYEQSETRRRQIAEAALATIAEDGVSKFTTRAIAARVGISDGTLFRHFANKQEIVLEAMGLLEAEIEAGIVTTDSPLHDLEQFFRHRAAFVGREGSVGRLIFSESLVHLAGDAGQQQINRWRKVSVTFLLDRLAALKKAHITKTEVQVPVMNMLIQGALLTFAMQASLGRSGGDAALQARIDQSWQALSTLFFI